jgi:predicted RNA-binding Zn-ribbon protein involved in translation (DUF1610 family)
MADKRKCEQCGREIDWREPHNSFRVPNRPTWYECADCMKAGLEKAKKKE